MKLDSSSNFPPYLFVSLRFLQGYQKRKQSPTNADRDGLATPASFVMSGVFE